MSAPQITRPAPRASLLGDDRALDRDHGADGRDGAERRRRRRRNVGRAVPLRFIVATIGVILVSYGFVRLAGPLQPRRLGLRVQRRDARAAAPDSSPAGRCSAPTSRSRRPRRRRSGSSSAQFLNGTGIWSGSEWILIALVAALLIGLLAYGDIKITTRALLSMEAISVTLIIDSDGRDLRQAVRRQRARRPGDTLDDVFSLPGGVWTSTLRARAVLAFLSFAGFEGAAALGEETSDPAREIPRAIRNAVLAAGASSTSSAMLPRRWGSAPTPPASRRSPPPASPLGDLGIELRRLVRWGRRSTSVPPVSGFASSLGTATGASRILYRDGAGRLRHGAGWARPRTHRRAGGRARSS